MSAAILLLTLGGWLVYSSLKGQSLVESLTGTGGDSLDPKGGSVDFVTPTGSASSESHPSSGTVSKHGFHGPNADLLDRMTDVATSKYNLHTGQLCRPQNASYGAPDSLHKDCRAIDLLGSVADRVAFARYAAPIIHQVGGEVFCDQAGMSAPGYEHTSHLHMGA